MSINQAQKDYLKKEYATVQKLLDQVYGPVTANRIRLLDSLHVDVDTIQALRPLLTKDMIESSTLDRLLDYLNDAEITAMVDKVRKAWTNIS